MRCADALGGDGAGALANARGGGAGGGAPAPEKNVLEPASLTGEGADGKVEAFAALGASMQAATQPMLDGEIESAAVEEETKYQEGLPEITVEMTGEGEEGGGSTTVETAAESGINAIVVEADCTLVLGEEEVRSLCEKYGVSILAISEE